MIYEIWITDMETLEPVRKIGPYFSEEKAEHIANVVMLQTDMDRYDVTVESI